MMIYRKSLIGIYTYSIAYHHVDNFENIVSTNVTA